VSAGDGCHSSKWDIRLLCEPFITGRHQKQAILATISTTSPKKSVTFSTRVRPCSDPNRHSQRSAPAPAQSAGARRLSFPPLPRRSDPHHAPNRAGTRTERGSTALAPRFPQHPSSLIPPPAFLWEPPGRGRTGAGFWQGGGGWCNDGVFGLAVFLRATRLLPAKLQAG